MSHPSYRDILLRDKGKKMRLDKFVDLMNKSRLEQKKRAEEEDSTDKVGWDRKKLNSGIWTINPIDLKVNPGSKVILEDILVSPAQRVNKRSLIKEWQEFYNNKYVCIFMLPMSSSQEISTVLDTLMLRDIQHQIESSGGKFSVICVPTHFQAELEREHLGYDEYFDPYTQHFGLKLGTSFHHIDIDDHACLKQIESTIGLLKDPETIHVILGPMSGSCREVVSILDRDFIKWYGGEAYPFTIGKLQQLELEDEALRSAKYDLVTLLCGLERDFVVSNDCTKVPISELEHKTVCLLFYEDHVECRKRTEELKQVYELRKDFEVVVVFPINFGQRPTITSIVYNKWKRELEFWRVFSNMPWLAVPFEDPKCRQLWRIFMRTKLCNDSNAHKLIIIHSKGKYFEENGFQVLKETRFTNYPFIGKKVVPSTIAVRGKKLTSILEPNVELLRPTDLDDANGTNCNKLEKFKVSELFGTRVVFLFARAPRFCEFLSELQYYHFVASQSIDKLEIIYVPMMQSSSNVVPHWMLASPSAEFEEKHLIPIFHHFFRDKITQNAEKEFTLATVTFESFGHYFNRGIIYSNSYKAAYELFVKTFPFNCDEDKETFLNICSAVSPKSFPLSNETEKEDKTDEYLDRVEFVPYGVQEAVRINLATQNT
ncbi:hypothetical protein OROMI_030225 [Orobanche minor]